MSFLPFFSHLWGKNVIKEKISVKLDSTFTVYLYLCGAQECCFLWLRVIEKSQDRKMGSSEFWILFREPRDHFGSVNFCNKSEQFALKNGEEELAVSSVFPFMLPVRDFFQSLIKCSSWLHHQIVLSPGYAVNVHQVDRSHIALTVGSGWRIEMFLLPLFWTFSVILTT